MISDDSHNSIQRQIVTILHQHCGVQHQPVASQARLQEDLGLDSMGLITLALEIENHWQLYLAEPPEAPPQTIGELVALVAQRLQEQHHQDV
jgi:acyl carrier protein